MPVTSWPQKHYRWNSFIMWWHSRLKTSRTRRTENFAKNQRKLARTCGFRRDAQKRTLYPLTHWMTQWLAQLLIRDYLVCMGLWDLMTMSHVQNEISSPSNRSNCRILIKTPIFAFWIIQKGILPNYAWTITRPTCWKTFTTAIICNIKSLGATKFEKKANVHMCTIYAHCA